MILHYFSKEPVDIIVHIGKQKQIHFKTLQSSLLQVKNN